MVEKHPLPLRIGCLLLTVFWGIWIVLGVLYRVVTSPRKFFHAKDYSKLPAVARTSSDWTFGDIVISTPDQLALNIFYAAAGERSNPLMLLVHGFPECWYSWRYQIREFSKDYRVVAIDTRGYGGSSKPSSLESYALENLVEDLPALILALGYQKATVIGHDWGGAMTWLFASKYPQMCERLVILNCPHPKAQFKAFQSDLKQLMASWYMFYFMLPCIPEIVMRSNDFSMLAATLMGRKGGVKSRTNMDKGDLEVFKHSLNYWEARRSAHNYIRANLTYSSTFPRQKISTPILLIWGEQDLFLTRQMAEMSRAYVTDLRIEYIAESSHWVQQDCPQRVNQCIREYFTKSSS